MTRNTARIIGASMLAMAVLVLCTLPLTAQNNGTPQITVDHAVAFGVSERLSDMATLPPTILYGFHETEPPRHVDFHPGRGQLSGIDPVEQSFAGRPAFTIMPGLSIEGIANLCSCYPPDPNASVGDTQVAEVVNFHLEVFNKTTGASELGPILISQIFSALGSNRCAVENDGDPTIVYDKVNHVWLITQFEVTNPAFFCAAVSTSSNATGSYNVYAFSTTDFNDYPKWGIWPTGYFATDNHFNNSGTAYLNARLHAFNGVKMRAGDPTAEHITATLTNSDYSILPADVDSPTPPPSGQPEFFIGSYDVDTSNNHLYLYSMAPNFPAGTAVVTGSGLANPITVATYIPFCDSSRSCVPEPGGSFLDAIGDRAMYRFAYWNDGQTNVPPCVTCGTPRFQRWYVNHTAKAGGGQAGVRWYEFNAPEAVVNTSALTVFQSGTYAPDSNYRWMASMARDRVNNVAVGFSISNGTSLFPSISVAGRAAGDPVGQLSGEIMLTTGTGSETGSQHRWGDYTSMSLDPVDGCTFWYTNEYLVITGTAPWHTKLNQLKFSNCH